MYVFTNVCRAVASSAAGLTAVAMCATSGSSASGATMGASASPTSTGQVAYASGPIGSGTLSVSYTDPPPEISLAPFGFVELGDALYPQVAVTLDGGAYVIDPSADRAYHVSRDGAIVGPIELDVTPTYPVTGPDAVVYGFAQSNLVAVSMHPDNVGTVVARQAIDESTYIEPPNGVIGRGPGGIIDRLIEPGRTLMGYVDHLGAPITDHTAPRPLTIDGADVVTDAASGTTWPLLIERDPAYTGPYGGESPPAAFDFFDGPGGVVWTWLGPQDPTPGADEGPTMPVVAVLSPGGGGGWYSIPDGWSVASSDGSGTILTRISRGGVELARLTDDLSGESPPCADYIPNDTLPLRLCDAGHAVGFVQRTLNTAMPERAPLAVDGYFGPFTDDAVREFQRRRDLADDGLVGPKTWAALLAVDPGGADTDASGRVDPDEITLHVDTLPPFDDPHRAPDG